MVLDFEVARESNDPLFPWDADQGNLEKFGLAPSYLVFQCALHSGKRGCRIPIRRQINLLVQAQIHLSAWGNGSASTKVIVHRYRNGVDDPKVVIVPTMSWHVPGDRVVSEQYSKIQPSFYPFEANDILEITLDGYTNTNADEVRVLVSGIAQDNSIPATPSPIWIPTLNGTDELIEENMEVSSAGVFVCTANVTHQFDLPRNSPNRRTAGISSFTLYRGATVEAGTEIGRVSSVGFPRTGFAHTLPASATLTQFVRAGKFSVKAVRASEFGQIARSLAGKIEFRSMNW